MSRSQEKQTWWEKALYSPLFPPSECEGKETGVPSINSLGLVFHYEQETLTSQSEDYLPQRFLCG